MINSTILKAYQTVLECLFFVGCLRALLLLRKNTPPLPQRALPTVMVGLFILPFLFYAIIGIFISKFGHERNFFYLLPLYFFFIFYGLEALLRTRLLFNTGVLFLICFLVAAGFLTMSSAWENTYRGRALLRLASTLEADEVFVPYAFSHTPWAFFYYAKRFHFPDKVTPYLPPDQPVLFEEDGKFHPVRRMIVIEDLEQGHGSAKGSKYEWRGIPRNIKNVKIYIFQTGPGGYGALFMNPFTVATVYFLQDE